MPADTPRQGSPLSLRLVLLVGAVSVPLILLGAGALRLEYEADRDRAETQLVEQARSLARLVDGEFDRVETAALTLAASSALARGDLSAFAQEMSAARNLISGGGTEIALYDLSGLRLLGPARPGEETRRDAPDLAYVRAAIASGQPRKSDLIALPGGKGVAVGVAVPLTAGDEATRSSGAISVTLPRARLLDIVTAASLPPGAFASVQDRQGLTVARSFRDAETLGKLPMPAVLEAIRGAPAGLAPRGTRTLEGVPSVIAFAHAPASGFIVKLDVPEEVFLAPFQAALLRAVLVGGGVLAAGLGLALLRARRIVASFGKVAETAMGAGAPPGTTGLREADDLAAALSAAIAGRERADASLRALFESSPIGVIISDTGGRVHEANNAFLRIIGRDRADLEAGRIRWDEITPDEWIGRDERAIAEAVARGRCRPYEKEYVRPDGTRVPVLLSFGLTDRAIGLAATFVVDLTARREAEAALRDSEERLRLAQEAGGIGAWELDLVTGLRHWSDTAYDLWGLERGRQVTADLLMGLIHEDDRERAGAALARARTLEGPLPDLEFRIRRASDGAVRWINSHSRIVARDEASGVGLRQIGVMRDVTKRREAEAALREAKERMDLALQGTDAGLWDWNVETGEVWFSERWCTMLGYAQGEIEPHIRSWERLVHHDDMPAITWVLEDHLAGRTPLYEGEHRLRHRDGHWVWVLSRGKLVERGEDGRPLRAVGTHQDITARRAAEDALRESEARFARAVSVGGIGTWDWEAATDRQVNSPGFEALYGRAPGEVGSKSDFLALVHQEDRAAVEAAIGRAVAGGEGEGFDVEYRIPLPGGGFRWLRSQGAVTLRGEDGAPLRMSGVVTDVTERAEAEQARIESEARFRAVADAMPQMAWSAGPDGRTDYWNARAYEFTGRDPGTLGSFAREDIIHPDDLPALREAWNRARETGEPFEMEHRLRYRDGTYRWVLARALAVRGTRGEVHRWFGTSTDISEIVAARAAAARQAQELEARVAERTRALSDAAQELRAEIQRREEAQSALLQAQKLEALGQLTGGVAHDFNNVLAAVFGSYSLIRRRTDSPAILEVVARGEQSAERARKLVSQLLTFARRGELRPEVLDLASVMLGAEDLICHAIGQGIRCALELPPGIWPVLADAHQLEVALLNLAVNARDAMEGQGTLTIAARNLPRPERPAHLPPGEYVEVAVRDTGAGMPPEVVARATEPFFTTKPQGKGTGLGLAMVHGFAVQSGGALAIESRPGEGTAIRIILPRAALEDEGIDLGEDEGPDAALHGNATLLLAEDDEQVRAMTAALLRELGYTVAEAANAEAAAALVHTLDRCDMLVTDVTMPGVDGPTLARRLRAERPDLPVLFLTAHSPGAEQPPGPVLRKPFGIPALGAAVLEGLGRWSRPSAGDERLLARLRTPAMRRLYLAWEAARSGPAVLPRPGSVDPAAFDLLPHSFVADVLPGEPPRFSYRWVGEALAERLGHPLPGGMATPGAQAEVLGSLEGAYRRCARTLRPLYQAARYDLGDGVPLRFERLILPVSADGRELSELIGVALFDDASP